MSRIFFFFLLSSRFLRATRPPVPLPYHDGRFIRTPLNTTRKSFYRFFLFFSLVRPVKRLTFFTSITTYTTHRYTTISKTVCGGGGIYVPKKRNVAERGDIARPVLRQRVVSSRTPRAGSGQLSLDTSTLRQRRRVITTGVTFIRRPSVRL